MTIARVGHRRAGQAGSIGLLSLVLIYLLYASLRLLGAPGGSAVHFDGLDDRVTFGPAPALGVTTFTIETWFRRDGPGATATTGAGGIVAVPLVTKGMSEADGDNRDTNYFLGIDARRRVLVADFEDTVNGGNHPVYGVTPICDGVWYHAAATYDGTTWRLYLNGALETQLVVGSFAPRSDSIQHAALGSALNSSGTAAGAFLGALDEVRIWNVALDATQIQSAMLETPPAVSGLIGRWSMNENSGTSVGDTSGSGVTGTLRNGPTWTAGSPFVPTPPLPGEYGVKMKGTTVDADYVSFGAAPGLNASSFTVEAWFKREAAGVTTTTGSGGLTSVVPLVTKGRSDGDATSADINYFLGISGNQLAADFEEGAAGAYPGLNHPITGITAIQDNQWYHGAVTYDGVTLQLYLNGVLEAATVVNRPARADSIEQAAIGTALNSAGVAAGFFAGTVDEVRIWSYSRTASQIAAGLSRKIPEASGLLGRWGFDECCGTAPDSSGAHVTGTLFGRAWTWVDGGPLSGIANAAPVAEAGLDQQITLPALALLSGSFTDDGRSGSPVTTQWSKTSGPGTVTFASAGSLATTATFSIPGTYVLTLTVTDGEIAASDSIAIQVDPGVPNLPPVVDAGPDRVADPSVPVDLTGSAVDDGLPSGTLVTTWSKVSGPGTVTFANTNAPETTATFDTAGSYVLMLSGSDGLLSGSDLMTVMVTAARPSDGAIDFGGSNAYVALGPAPGLGAATFTIEAWFRRDGTGTTTSTGSSGMTAVPIVTKGRSESDGSTVDMNYFLGIRSDGVLAADFEEGATGASPGLNHPVAGTTVIQNNVWYHGAATYDGTKWQLFLNGVLERELTVGRPPRADSIQHAAIGSALNSSGAPSGYFNGAIDEVRIWSMARTGAQIVAGMSGEIQNAPNLLGRWGLNEGTGTAVADSTGHGNGGSLAGSNWSWTQGAPMDVTPNTAPAAPVLIGPATGGTAASPATLTVQVSDADTDPMTVTYYGRPKTIAAPDFTYVTIPDTQHYVDNATFPGTFTAQTNWIVANRAAMNIAFVSQLGDLTEHIDQYEIEWQRADASMRVLDVNGVPYGVAPGNHDESAAGVANRYDQYFPVARFLGYPWYLGYLGAEVDDPVNRQNKNNYELFSVGGLDFLAIHIDLDWPDYSVAWADKIIKRYPNRRVILSSHAFVDTTNTRPTSAQFRSNGTSAEAVWQQIIKPNCNVFMVVNGHYPGEGRRTDLNNCGQPVHQVLMDYQSRQNGGDGWLRYFVFKPSQNKIYAYTYSPTRNGGAGDFETDADSQFVLDYDMQGAPFSVIGTSTGVASGATASATWNNLVPGGEYEWYVEINDGRTTTTGPAWTFSASAAANTPPVAANDAYSLAEDTPLTVAAPGVLGNDSDADGNPLTVTLQQNASHGTVILDTDGRFTYTPAANYNGPDSFGYTASDGRGGTSSATVSVTVTGVNDAPSAVNDAYSATEDIPLVVATPGVLGNDTDVDGNPLTATMVTSPAHGTLLSSGDGSFTYTPAANYYGTDSFTYRASDGTAQSAVATVTLTIAAVNDAPVAVPDSYVTLQDTPLTVPAPGLLANDSDVEGSALTAATVTNPAHGTATVNANGSFTYIPAAGYVGPDSFTYRVNDGAASSAAVAVTLLVTAVADTTPPVRSNGQPSGTLASGTTSTTVQLTTDEPATCRYALTAGTSYAAMPSTFANTGATDQRTTVSGLTGGTTYTYYIRCIDVAGNANASDFIVTFSVSPAATAGLVAALGFNEGTGTTTADASGAGHTGTLSGPVWMPGRFGSALSFDGINDVVTVNDSTALDLTTAMTLEAWVNPRTGSGWRTVLMKERVGELAYTLYGSSGNGRPSAEIYTSASLDVRGTASLALNTWTHLAATYDGATLRLYRNGTQVATRAVSGAIATSDSPLRIGGNLVWGEYFDGLIDEIRIYNRVLTATEIQTDMNAPVSSGPSPVAASDAYSLAEDSPLTVAAPGVLGNDTPGDGTQLMAVLQQSASHGTVILDADGRFTYTPPANFNGTDSFTYRASDGIAQSAVATVTLTIAAVNDAPVAVPDSYTTLQDTPLTVSAPGLLANDSDVEGSALTAAVVTNPAHGTATVNANGSFTYTPAAGYAGPDSFTYRVNDGAANSAAVTVTLTVTAANPAGLVAAFGFNEGAGTTTADTSGRGHTGTLSGALWTTGRFGSALSFDGIDDLVTVGDSTALDLTTAMTLEAWVNPRTVTGWRTVLMKERVGQLTYALYGNSDTDRPSAEIYTSANLDVRGTASLALNTWTHLAVTYDGATLRLYRNGTQVATRAISGAIATSGSPLRIGGNLVWGEYFDGLIDEIRIYNRVLTATEIQTDMNAPVPSAP